MDVISRDPNIMGGTPCFSGTRVPIQNLFDYLEHGHSVGRFIEDFSTVQNEQVMQVLELASRKLLGEAVVAA